MINVVSRRNHRAILTVGCDEFETGKETFIVPITDIEYEFTVSGPKSYDREYHETRMVIIDRLYTQMVEKFGDVFSDPADRDYGDDWGIDDERYE